jgi:putative ABC transport system permease protein
MSYFIKLVTKNLFRNKLRTCISLIAIIIGVTVAVFARGMIQGFANNTISPQIHYNTGHIKQVDAEYKQQERLLPLNYPLTGFDGEDVSNLIEKIEAVNGVERTIPRIKFAASVAEEEELIKMMGWGVNPQQELKFTNLADYLTKGRMIEENKAEVVMGAGLLDELNRSVEDKVTILYNTSFNSFKG